MKTCSWCKMSEASPRALHDCAEGRHSKGINNMAVYLCDSCWTAYRFFDGDTQTEWRSTFIIHGDWMRMGA